MKLSAKEMRRYIYLRTDHLFDIDESVPEDENAVLFQIDKKLGQQEYSLKTSTQDSCKTLVISGGSDVAVLYGVYHTIETMGVRFYIHGDTIPDQKSAFRMPDLDETHKPIFDKRGLLPFHDFPEGGKIRLWVLQGDLQLSHNKTSSRCARFRWMHCLNTK